MRQEVKECTKIVLELTEQKELLENEPVTRRFVLSRLPFTDPLNILQVQALKGLRKENNETLSSVLAVTVQGIAAGMGATG